MPLVAAVFVSLQSVGHTGMSSHRAKQLSSSSLVYQRTLSVYPVCGAESSRPGSTTSPEGGGP